MGEGSPAGTTLCLAPRDWETVRVPAGVTPDWKEGAQDVDAGNGNGVYLVEGR